MAKKQFKAESKRLLDLMINSIYTNKEIFLREIISNASDALDKLHYISLTDETARAAINGALEIKVSVDNENRTITVSDNGIGMSKEELETNLGTICKSGSLAFKDGIPDDEKTAANIIGQFGVGFYSAFMVADSVSVVSKKYDSDVAFKWTSTGADGYTVTEAEKDTIGTVVAMHLKDDTENEKYSEYLQKYRIEALIKNYSDYVPYPIIMENETLNSMTPIWKRAKGKVKRADSDKFYKDNFFDTNEPAATIQISAEGVVSYKALLFVPSLAPYNYFTKDYKKGLKLYSNGVLIMDACEDLLPDHFRFVKGVVDSDDLSLNISREMLQQDHQLRQIAANIEKKIKAELKKLMDKERETYEKFYSAFAFQLKYGITADFGAHKDLLSDLLLFYSMKEEKMISLKEYTEKMSEGQKYIYYACGESAAKIISMPQTELVRNKGYDMLCLTDEVDEFVVNIIAKVGDTEFCSINSEKSDLFDENNSDATESAAAENKELLEFLKNGIEGISGVVISKKLKSHAVCLSASGGVTIEMEKYFAAIPGDGPKPKAEKVLELNSTHPAFQALKKAYAEDTDKALRLGKILYNQALLIADLPIDNPAEYTELICSLM